MVPASQQLTSFEQYHCNSPPFFIAVFLACIRPCNPRAVHPVGNQRFRSILQGQGADAYEQASSKKAKGQVIIDIVNSIRRANPNGGGFVRKDYEIGRWIEIGETKAREKVGNTIRIEVRKRRQEDNTQYSGVSRSTSSVCAAKRAHISHRTRQSQLQDTTRTAISHLPVPSTLVVSGTDHLLSSNSVFLHKDGSSVKDNSPFLVESLQEVEDLRHNGPTARAIHREKKSAETNSEPALSSMLHGGQDPGKVAPGRSFFSCDGSKIVQDNINSIDIVTRDDNMHRGFLWWASASHPSHSRSDNSSVNNSFKESHSTALHGTLSSRTGASPSVSMFKRSAGEIQHHGIVSEPHQETPAWFLHSDFPSSILKVRSATTPQGSFAVVFPSQSISSPVISQEFLGVQSSKTQIQDDDVAIRHSIAEASSETPDFLGLRRLPLPTNVTVLDEIRRHGHNHYKTGDASAVPDDDKNLCTKNALATPAGQCEESSSARH